MIKYIVNSLTDIEEEFYPSVKEDYIFNIAKLDDSIVDEAIEQMLLAQDEDNDARKEWIEKIRSKTVTDVTEATYDEDGEELTPRSENTYVQLEEDETEESLLAEFIDYPTYDVATWKLKNYAKLRQALYGTWQQQLEMQADGTWDQHIIDVKAKYPKPDSPIVDEEPAKPEVVIVEGRLEDAE